MSRIAVHIVTFNSASHIVQCIDALKSQDADFDLLVIDNASGDETLALIQERDIPFVANSANKGYSAAHNLALRMTDSDYVLTLNPDVVLQPGYLSAMVAALDQHPEHGSAAGCLLRVNDLHESPYAIDSVGLYMRRNRRQGLLLDNAPVDHIPASPQPIFGPDGAAALYRRSMLKDIAVEEEVFDEDFFMHKEDIDLCWRAQLLGWTSVYVPEAIAHHIRTFRPNRRERVNAYLRMCAVRNRYLVMLKNELPRLFWRDILRISMYDVLIFGYVLLREPVSLRGFVSALGLRKRMLHKRRLIQAKRRASYETMAQLFT